MAQRLPPLNSLRAFESAARLMSFQKAASELNVTPSALSYQIRQLEDHLQISLFERLNRAVALTGAGERLYPGVHTAFVELQGAVRSLGQLTSSNVLVISSGPAFSAKWLAPRVYQFVDEHPDTELRIAANLNLVDFERDEVDVAIRFGAGNYPGLAVEPLFHEVVLPLVSPQLLSRHAGRITRDDLQNITLLHDDSTSFMSQVAGWREWLAAEGLDTDNASRGPRFNHADHGLDAAIDGAGIVMGRLSLAMRDIRSGRLVAPFNTYLQSEAGFYFVTPEKSLEMDKVASFRLWLMDQVAKEAEEIVTFLSDKKAL